MPPPVQYKEDKSHPLRGVTREDPCTVCRGGHKCSRSKDGLVLCGRKDGDQPGFLFLGKCEKDPTWSMYRPEPGNDSDSNHPNGFGPPPVAIDWGREAVNYRDELTPERARTLAASLGLIAAVMGLLGAGYHSASGAWTLPERDASGAVVGISLRRRDGSKSMLPGGSRGLYYAPGWADGDGPVLLPEGFSDTATLLTMGLAVVGRPSNTGGVSMLGALLERLPANRAIIVVGENDTKPDGRWPGRDGAEVTAERLAKALNRPIRVALPPDGTKDVRDYFRKQDPDLDNLASLDKLGRSLVATLLRDAREIAPWEPVHDIEDPELPTFPTQTLASWQGSFVEALATTTQTPVDLGAMLVLSAAAVAVAKKAIVRVRGDYSEPLNIFAVVAQPPASRKSAVFRNVAAPVEEYEHELATLARPVIAGARNQAEVDKRTLDELQRKASKAEEAERANLIEQSSQVAIDLETRKMPEAPQLLLDDATQEAVVNRMAANGGRIGIMSPEGGIFGMMGGRYSQAKVQANLDIYLKGHAGDQIRVQRMNRPTEFIDAPALSIGLAVQNEVIRGLAANPGFRGVGLLARFLYSMPRSLVGQRQVDPPSVPEAVREGYRSKTRSLLAMTSATDGAGEPVEHVIVLSPGAYSEWRDFERWIEPQLDEFGALGHIGDWAGKLAGAVARIAGLLHLADHADHGAPWSIPVPSETMARAVAIGQYLIPHARAAFAEMWADPAHADARHLLAWIRRNRSDSFSRREAYEATKGRFKQVEYMEPSFEHLTKHNYIRRRPDPVRSGPGRPKGPIFDVNPGAFAREPGPGLATSKISEATLALMDGDEVSTLPDGAEIIGPTHAVDHPEPEAGRVTEDVVDFEEGVV